MKAATRLRPWTVDKTQPRSLDHVANVFQSEVETITESRHRYKSSRWIARRHELTVSCTDQHASHPRASTVFAWTP